MTPVAPSPLPRRTVLRGAALLPLASLAGCVVAPHGPYHRPSTPQSGAQLRQAWCQGRAGPQTGIELAFAGLRLSARTEPLRPPAQPGLALVATLALPPGRSLQWTGAPRLFDEGGPMAVVPTATAQRAMTVRAGAWIDPFGLRPGSGPADAMAPHGTVSVRVAPVAAMPPRIVLEGLTLERTGARFVLPPSELARPASRSLPDLYRSAGEQAAVRGRADACRRDTPQQACDNIVEFSHASHAGQDAVVRWHGRWYQSVPARGTPQLEGEMTLVPLQAGRWRLDDEAFRVRAVDGSDAHPLRVAQARLAFDDRLDPGALVPASGVETHIQVQATLPADAPSFELRLPTLLVNGERVEPPPVRFERRSWGAGVEPFNC